MFQSSGEITVSVRHLVIVTVWTTVWSAGSPGRPVSRPHRVKVTKCHIDTVISPDDGHIVAQNM